MTLRSLIDYHTIHQVLHRFNYAPDMIRIRSVETENRNSHLQRGDEYAS
ncbi:MAG: hypothetical protein M1393_05315 [Candidatus Thermoplasmatota archaeon]|nr:hypothetical protein [Candidatus Thermoplasmatota archaeon]